MRSLAFNLAFWTISIFYTAAAALATLVPGHQAVRAIVARYTRSIVWAMRNIAGIDLEVRGRERLPVGDFILAPKHASYGDGFCAYAQFGNLAIVTGDHLERFPLFKNVLKKLGAIVIDSYGGSTAQKDLNRSAAEAHAEGRCILIYPEGHLTAVDVYYQYRSGVYHMARDLNLPVVPAASNLGLFWPKEAWRKKPGTAVLEFLEPIIAGSDEDAFLFALQSAIENRTAELIAVARGAPVRRSVLGLSPSEAKRAAKAKTLES
jgi:1-acyl-sn-glycerol-3-phosphate acyltransferase